KDRRSGDMRNRRGLAYEKNSRPAVLDRCGRGVLANRSARRLSRFCAYPRRIKRQVQPRTHVQRVTPPVVIEIFSRVRDAHMRNVTEAVVSCPYHIAPKVPIQRRKLSESAGSFIGLPR